MHCSFLHLAEYVSDFTLVCAYSSLFCALIQLTDCPYFFARSHAVYGEFQTTFYCWEKLLICLIQVSESQHKGTNVSFFVSLVVDKERMRSGHQLRLVICVSPWVIVLTLVIGWEEAHLVRKTLFHLSQRFHPEQVEKKDHGGTNLRGRMAAVILAVPVSLCISLSVCQYVETVGY